MKLKNKLRRRLFPIKIGQKLNIGDELKYNKKVIGKILISEPLPFALIKLFDPDFLEFRNKEISVNNKQVQIKYDSILTNQS